MKFIVNQLERLKVCFQTGLVIALMSITNVAVAQGFPTQALKDAQKYSTDSYAKSQVIFEYDLPHSFGDASVSRVFEGENDFIQVQYADGSKWKTSAQGVVPTADSFVLNPEANMIAFVGYNTVTLIDTKAKNVVQCPAIDQASQYKLVHSGNSIYGGTVIDDYTYNKHNLIVFKVDFAGGICALKTIGTFPLLANTYRQNFFDLGGKLAILLPQAKWFAMTGSDSVDFITLSFDGSQSSKINLLGFKLTDEEPEVFPNPSSGLLGVLVPLASVNDPEQHTNLYLLNGVSQPKLIAKNALSGIWIDNQRILVNRGSHATSSQLVLLSGDGFTNETIVNPVEGFKRNVFLDRGSLYYTNETHDLKRFNFKVSGVSFMNVESVALRSPVSPGSAKIPTTREVSYPSGNHQVASILSVPEGGCTSSEKRHVLVYAHGGNEHTSPTGHRLSNYGSMDSEYLLFTQLGWVVLEMNYYGDTYLGSDFSNGMDGYLDRDRRSNTMLDYQSAGLFAKSLPCADPNHIVLIGHSYGSDMVGLYITQKEFESSTAYTGVVLQGGSLYGYGFPNDMTDENPRIAVANGEGNKHLNPSIQSSAPVISPTQPLVGIESALQVLDTANASGQNYYGVIYQMSDETLNAITPKLRVSQVIQKPILITAGHYDGNLQAGQAYEADLKNHSELIQSWYPSDPTGNHEDAHVYAGSVQLDYVKRVVDFSN